MLLWLMAVGFKTTLTQTVGSEMFLVLFQNFMVFVPGVVTQRNEDERSVQHFVLLFLV